MFRPSMVFHDGWHFLSPLHNFAYHLLSGYCKCGLTLLHESTSTYLLYVSHGFNYIFEKRNIRFPTIPDHWLFKDGSQKAVLFLFNLKFSHTCIMLVILASPVSVVIICTDDIAVYGSMYAIGYYMCDMPLATCAVTAVCIYM